MKLDDRKMEAAFRFLHGRDYTFAELQYPQRMNRKLITLKKYARRYRLRFPDYVPRSLKTKA